MLSWLSDNVTEKITSFLLKAMGKHWLDKLKLSVESSNNWSGAASWSWSKLQLQMIRAETFESWSQSIESGSPLPDIVHTPPKSAVESKSESDWQFDPDTMSRSWSAVAWIMSHDEASDASEAKTQLECAVGDEDCWLWCPEELEWEVEPLEQCLFLWEMPWTWWLAEQCIFVVALALLVVTASNSCNHLSCVKWHGGVCTIFESLDCCCCCHCCFFGSWLLHINESHKHLAFLQKSTTEPMRQSIILHHWKNESKSRELFKLDWTIRDWNWS